MATRQPATRTPGMVSLAEAAELAGLSIRTLRRIAEGALPAYRTGPRLIRVHPDDLVTLVVPLTTRRPSGWAKAPAMRERRSSAL